MAEPPSPEGYQAGWGAVGRRKKPITESVGLAVLADLRAMLEPLNTQHKAGEVRKRKALAVNCQHQFANSNHLAARECINCGDLIEPEPDPFVADDLEQGYQDTE